MTFQPETVAWPDRRAIVLVHGVGQYAKANYEDLLAELESAIGTPEWKKIAVYTTLYDVFNQWVAEKERVRAVVADLVGRLRSRFDSDAIGKAAADGAGDVVWPVLSREARGALRDAIIAQLVQVVSDGDDAGVERLNQKITIVCHSLGCFHTYEVLWAMAKDRSLRMRPTGDGVRFDNVLMFASPVQLIRSVAGSLGELVPDPAGLATLGAPLAMPGETAGHFVSSARRFVSITGDLDPVGGFLMRKKLDWAYMDVPGQQSHLDLQTLAAGATPASVAAALESARQGAGGLPFHPDNPHDWIAYVRRNADLVKQCVLG